MTLGAIQALRALAALMVVMHHAQGEAAILAQRGGVAFSSATLLPWPAGVDVFFVISGFIIVHAAGPLYGVAGGWARFLAHRVARLVPLYWLATGLYLAILLGLPSLLSQGGRAPPEPGFIAASFLFWPALDADGRAQPLYSLGWTLHCEMAFYLLFALALALGWSRGRAVAFVAGILAALAVLHASVPDLPTPLSFWSAPIGLEFALGAAIGLARARGLRLSTPLRLALALAGLALLALAPEPGAIGRPFVYGLPAMLLVAAAGLGGGDRPMARRDWPGRAAIGLGDASYALYLVHPFVLRAVRMALAGLAPPASPWIAVAVMVALTIPAALLVHRFVERPLVARLRALLDPAARMGPAWKKPA